MLASESHVRTIRKPPGDRARIEVECFRKNSGNLRARKLIRFSFREYNGRKVHFRLRADVVLSIFANDFLTFQREIQTSLQGKKTQIMDLISFYLSTNWTCLMTTEASC